MADVGLGYIHLGQAATILSGGEAQRLKLSRELSKRGTGRTVYILDEPTTGLHFADIQKLLEVLNYLVELKNTVVVIEHNLEVIKTADHVIDLGPEGGEKGGYVVGTGTPEEIAEIIILPLADFLKEGVLSEEYRTVNKKTNKVSIYHSGGHVIWGATAWMLRQFLELIPPEELRG